MIPIEIEKPTTKFEPRGGVPIQRIVVHDTAGSMPGCLDWLQIDRPGTADNVSIHVLVTKYGDIFRLVPDEMMAWHCRGYNSISLGIEMERARDDEDGPYPESQLEAAAAWIAVKCVQYGIPLNKVHAHAELDPGRRRDPRNFPWEPFLIRVAEIILNART